MAGKQKSDRIMSTGFGDSALNIATEPFEQQGEIDWSKLTLNGEPIPEHLYGLLTYRMTDQGAADFNEGKVEARARVLREPGDPDFEASRFADTLKSDLPFEEQHDPIKLLMDAHTPKGHRGLMMGEAKCSKEGLRRGVLDYQPVLDENGERIKLGGMFLASVPERLAQRADQYYADKARQMQQKATDDVREKSDQVFAESDLRKLNRRKNNALDLDGVTNEDPEMVTGELGHEFSG